jgi:hypothetical protein
MTIYDRDPAITRTSAISPARAAREALERFMPRG